MSDDPQGFDIIADVLPQIWQWILPEWSGPDRSLIDFADFAIRGLRGWFADLSKWRSIRTGVELGVLPKLRGCREWRTIG